MKNVSASQRLPTPSLLDRRLSRRHFVSTTGAILTAALVGCRTQAHRRAAAGGTVLPSRWEEASVAELRAALQTGELTSVALTEFYLGRIAAFNQAGPGLRAVLEINPDALEIARERDRAGKGDPRGPLHGIPVLLKDNIDSHDRMTNTAGSLALEGVKPARDAFITEQLRRAGAVLLGKANLSEWANFRSTHSSSGWSARGGQTLNPYVLDRSPCGSSSGSGVAVAANLCAVAVGTETDGSIVCPASANGIVGLKPTVGLVSRSGIIPISHTQDTAGPMTRCVADAALLLGVMAGSDARDDATRDATAKRSADYTQFLDAEGLRGARIGVARKFFGFHAGVDQLMDAAIAEIKSCGAVVIDPADMPSGGRIGSSEYEVLLYEFKHGLNAYLGALGREARVHSLAELIEFNEQHRATEMPYFGQEIFLQAQSKGPPTDKAYLDALEKCRLRSRQEGIDAAMEEHKLDAIIAPTGGPAATIDLVYGDHGRGGCSSTAAVAGYPHITVPAGRVYELPVGLSFFGRAYSEATLLKLAYAYEQKTRHRQPPSFLATSLIGNP